MEEPRYRDPIGDACNAMWDGLRQIGDFSYAILPKDIAHGLADLKKGILKELTTAMQWEMEWIDNRVAGGDKLREEWKAKCQTSADTTSGPAA